jgi:hypothetical protein
MTIIKMVAYCDRLGLAEATLLYPSADPERIAIVAEKVVRLLGVPEVVGGDSSQ